MGQRLLGYCSLNHDPAVALLEDGHVRCAIESEKVTRHKREVSMFPEEAIRYALSTAGCAWTDLDAIVTNQNSGPIANAGYVRLLWNMLRAGSLDLGGIATDVLVRLSHDRGVFKRVPDHYVPPIVRVRHHLAHVAGAFLFSPFDSAAVVVVDACGELECTSVYHCEGRSVRKIYSMDLPVDSLGYVYLMATRHLGYGGLGDEYKVMGLAPYGERNASFREFFTELIALRPNGRYRVSARLAGRMLQNGWKFPPAVERRLGPRRRSDQEVTQVHKDFAFELQCRIEEAVVHVVRHVRRTVPARQLCLTGGVAMNSVANGRVLAEGLYSDVFVPPAPHDAGTALGAAAYHHFYRLGGDRPNAPSGAYLARAYSEAALQRELDRCRVAYTRVADPAAAAAELLVRGQIIGWFQGAAEFGPRALGNRSILADPRCASTRDRVNSKIKERESYRPFAPSILASHTASYFQHIRSSPFMSFVDTVRAEHRAAIAAVVHVDGSARPQTVVPEDNRLFYDLIAEFYRLTGVPAVLNTSFNVAGEPIVNTPADAIRCYFGSGLDALVIGPFVLQKQERCAA
jgi:carbamoyltransferase